MVTQEPQPDRCGARVVDKLGVEVRIGPEGDLDTLHFTDESVGLCRLVDTDQSPGHVVEVAPNYKTLRKWLWDGYHLQGLALRPDTQLGETEQSSGLTPSKTECVAHEGITGVDEDRPPMGPDLGGKTTSQRVGFDELDDEMEAGLESGTLTWVHVDPSTEHNVTNRYNELRGYCERYPLNEGVHCNDHTDTHSLQDGPHPNEGQHTPGSRITHGLYAQRTNYYKSLSDEDTAFVEGMVESWVQDAPFGRDNAAKVNELYRIAIDQHRAMNALDEFLDEDDEYEGMTKTQVIGTDDNGDPIHAVDEHPANLPYSRLDRDITKKLKELGVLGDDEIDEEDAKSIAKILSGGGE